MMFQYPINGGCQKAIFGSVLAAILVFAYTEVAQSSGPIIHTTTGQWLGKTEGNVEVWKGIPFAAPPVGDLRWRPPRPPAVDGNIGDATKFGHACPQLVPDSRPDWAKAFLEQIGIDEDCLTLNIWRPFGSDGKKLPIMFYIHGSGWKYASSSWPVWVGDKLAQRDVIVVTANYRLGLLGRFAHPAMSREQDGELLANYSVMDVLAALKWVNENAEAIGGDVENITVFGHSAGGVMVNFLMITPYSKDLFHKAIAQGSAVQLDCSRHLSKRGAPGPAFKSLEETGIEFAESQGISGSDQNILATLRNVPVNVLLEYPGPEFLFNPVIDGDLIPGHIAQLFEQGKQHNKPYIAGVADWEENQIANVPLIAKWFMAKPILEGLDNDDLKVFTGHWTRIGVSQQWFGDGLFTAATRHLVTEMKNVDAPSWLYHVTYLPEGIRDRYPGAPHGMEVPYLFGQIWEHPEYHRPTELILNEQDHKFGKIVQDYWVNFAKTGNPNGRTVPNWPPFNSEDDQTLELGNTILIRYDYYNLLVDYLVERAHIRRKRAGCQ